MGKAKKAETKRPNRIKLSPSEEQMSVFEQRREVDGDKTLATWALRRLWKAVQEDVAREKR